MLFFLQMSPCVRPSFVICKPRFKINRESLRLVVKDLHSKRRAWWWQWGCRGWRSSRWESRPTSRGFLPVLLLLLLPLPSCFCTGALEETSRTHSADLVVRRGLFWGASTSRDFTFHQQQDPLITPLCEPWRLQNDLGITPVDAVAAAVHIANPDVEGVLPGYQLHLHVALREVRWALVWILSDKGDVSVVQQFEFLEGWIHIGTGDQEVLPNGDADRRQVVLVRGGGEEQGLFTFNYATRDTGCVPFFHPSFSMLVPEVNLSWGINKVSFIQIMEYMWLPFKA